MLLVDESRAHVLMRHVKLYAYHHATSAHVNDMAVMLLHFLEFANKILAHLMRILNEMLALDDIENGKSGCASQMVATERCAEHAIDGFELGRDNHGTHRETVADALGAGDDVGTNAEPLVGEELAATSVAALYLVADEHRAVLLAG